MDASIIMSVIAVLISSAAIMITSRNSKKSDSVMAVLNLFTEFRSANNARRLIGKKLASECSCTSLGWDGLPDDLKESAKNVSHFFDHLGVLVAHNLVNKEAIFGWLGGSIERNWILLAPYIDAERKIRENDNYQKYFEILYETALKHPQSEIVAKLMDNVK